VGLIRHVWPWYEQPWDASAQQIAPELVPYVLAYYTPQLGRIVHLTAPTSTVSTTLQPAPAVSGRFGSALAVSKSTGENSAIGLPPVSGHAILALMPSDGTSNWIAFGGVNNDFQYSFVRCDAGVGIYRATNRGGSEVNATTAANWNDGLMHAVLYNYDNAANQMTLHVNGRQEASASLTITHQFDKIGFGGLRRSGWANSAMSKCALAVWFRSSLPESLREQLSGDVWSVFAPRTIDIPYSAAPALPTLTALPRIDAARRQDRYIWTP
jgi:hypothetical protein